MYKTLLRHDSKKTKTNARSMFPSPPAFPNVCEMVHASHGATFLYIIKNSSKPHAKERRKKKRKTVKINNSARISSTLCPPCSCPFFFFFWKIAFVSMIPKPIPKHLFFRAVAVYKKEKEFRGGVKCLLCIKFKYKTLSVFLAKSYLDSGSTDASRWPWPVVVVMRAKARCGI